MNNREVTAFFDALAQRWDENAVHDAALIGEILDDAGISAEKTVLDVGCGTGILIPDYLSRNVKSVTAVDLSPKMIAEAKKKHREKNVTFLCADAAVCGFDGKRFDCIVVYNALPHFVDIPGLIAHLSGLLTPGGTLTVAHGSSKDEIDRRHNNCARGVSVALPEAAELARLFSRYLRVTTVLSDDRTYRVTGSFTASETTAQNRS